MKRQYMVGAALAALLCAPVIVKLTRSDKVQIVEVDQVAYRDIRTSILASGVLLYEEQVLLSPEVIGKVSGVFVREGQRVGKGDLVLHLDDQSYKAEVAQREAAVRQHLIAIEQQQLNLLNQERQLRRTVELHKVKFVADSQIEDARYATEMARIELLKSRSNLDEARAILRQSTERLAKTIVRAPISGIVTALNIKVGETAVSSLGGVAGSNLMTVANTATMMTEINVDEADIAKVVVGQLVEIYSAAYPDVTIQGEVLTIPLSPKQNSAAQGQGAASQARSYSVRVKLVDTMGLILRPGMTCRAEIFTGGLGKSLALPLQAVLSNNKDGVDFGSKKRGEKNRALIKTENYVFVARNGKAEKRVIATGASDDSHQEVRKGLVAGEVVITGPYKILRHLNPGASVTTTTSSQGPAPGNPNS